MLVSSNRISNEHFRFQDYALFSDGAASFLVSDKSTIDKTLDFSFEIIDSEVGAHFQKRDEGQGPPHGLCFAW